MLSDVTKRKKTLFKNIRRFAYSVILYGFWNPTLIPSAYGVLLLGKVPPGGRRKKYRRWVVGFLLFLVTALTGVGLFNFAMDPLWCFDNFFPWNRQQLVFNGRQLKTNLVTFSDFRYRTLLVGSSRVGCLDQNDFTGMRAFNYAVNSMVPDEYQGFVRYAKKREGGDFSTIILGVDFFGTNANLKKEFDVPEYYSETANSFLYRYKMLLSYDVLGFSVDNLQQHLKQDKDTFERSNVRVPAVTTRANREQIVSNQLLWFMLEGYGGKYQYDEGLKEKLRRLRDDNPKTSFVVFTTPVAKPLFCLMFRLNHFADYERWLRDLVEVFGGVYNFMDLNSVTNEYLDTFTDAHHPTPETATYIVKRILSLHTLAVPGDFGTLVTRENIDQTLAGVRARCADCTDFTSSVGGLDPGARIYLRTAPVKGTAQNVIGHQ